MATDEKWDQLQAMRAARGDAPAAPASSALVIEMKRKAPEVAPAAPTEAAPAEQPRAADGTFAAKPAPVVEPPPAPEPPPAAAAVAVPDAIEIDLDGTKVAVAPEIAAAFQRAERIKADATKATERESLKSEIIDAVKAALPPPPPPKTDAELAAERAMQDALAPKRPDAKLLISDPEEWQKAQDAYEEHRVTSAIAREREAAAKQTRDANASAAAANEAAARAAVREEFYVAYPVFRGESEVLVDGLLVRKFDELVASGKLNKPLSPKERAEIKATEFADVATRATRAVVGVMQTGKKIAPPTPPPTLVSSAPARAATPPKPEEPKRAQDKYPKGSVSAILAAHKASREVASA